MAEPLSEIIPKFLERIIEQSPAKPAADEEEQRRQDREAEVRRRLENLTKLVGARYEGATFDSYQTATEAQKKALADLRGYAANLRSEVKSGRGILLFGTTGTGKDHLLIGLAREAIAALCPLLWVNGVDLHARMREGIRRDESEDAILGEYMRCRVLVLSDPLPPAGVLSDFQSATLYRLVDHRYRHMLPTWCSLNVADAKEARERLGPATVDRLRDGALAIECKWPSYRKARA